MIHRKHDHIKVDGKYWQCVVADSQDAVFAPLIKRNDCISTIFKNMFVVANQEADNDFEFEKAKLIRWDGSSIKRLHPMKNAIEKEIDENRTLIIKTKKGKLVFKKGQYLNYVDNIISKP